MDGDLKTQLSSQEIADKIGGFDFFGVDRSPEGLAQRNEALGQRSLLDEGTRVDISQVATGNPLIIAFAFASTKAIIDYRKNQKNVEIARSILDATQNPTRIAGILAPDDPKQRIKLLALPGPAGPIYLTQSGENLIGGAVLAGLPEIPCQIKTIKYPLTRTTSDLEEALVWKKKIAARLVSGSITEKQEKGGKLKYTFTIEKEVLPWIHTSSQARAAAINEVYELVHPNSLNGIKDTSGKVIPKRALLDAEGHDAYINGRFLQWEAAHPEPKAKLFTETPKDQPLGEVLDEGALRGPLASEMQLDPLYADVQYSLKKEWLASHNQTDFLNPDGQKFLHGTLGEGGPPISELEEQSLKRFKEAFPERYEGYASKTYENPRQQDPVVKEAFIRAKNKSQERAKQIEDQGGQPSRPNLYADASREEWAEFSRKHPEKTQMYSGKITQLQSYAPQRTIAQDTSPHVDKRFNARRAYQNVSRLRSAPRNINKARQDIKTLRTGGSFLKNARMALGRSKVVQAGSFLVDNPVGWAILIIIGVILLIIFAVMIIVMILNPSSGGATSDQPTLPAPGGGSANPIPGLTINKTGPGNVANGESIPYLIIVDYDQSTSGLPRENIVIFDPLPLNTHFESASGNFIHDEANRIVSWELADNPGRNFTLVVSPTEDDSIVINRVSAFANAPPGGGGSSGNACTEPFEGDGPCAVENLKPYFGGDGTKALIASMICEAESGSDPYLVNSVCPDYSIGLYQINLTVHCPGAYTGDPYQCILADLAARNVCEANFQVAENNIQKMMQLSGNGTNWSPWSTWSHTLGFPDVQDNLRNCGIL